MEAILGLLPPALFLLFALVERFFAARRFPRQPLWKTRGVLFFVAIGAVSTVLPMLVNEWLHAHRLFDGARLGLVGGTLVGFLAYQLLSYTYHRLCHNVGFMWRWFHQIHHSAERVDIYGAFMFHPFEMAAFTLLSAIGPLWLAGVDPMAAALAGAIGLFYTTFQHANIRTPAWLGWLIQRPEQHALHHERGVHAHNYADLPLVDWLFGTFRNPRTWAGQAGFHDGASRRLGAMLIGRDVSAGVVPLVDAPREATAPAARAA